MLSSVERELDPLALLAEAAASDAPLEAEHAELDRMVAVALLAARARRVSRRRRRVWLALAAGLLLAVGGGAMSASLWDRSEAPALATIAPSNELELPTGDRIVRLGEGSLAIEEVSQSARRFSVSAGHALFDVAPLGERERFEVVTPHLTATVVGTVFAISVEAERTRVHVFDGVVRVDPAAGETRELGRGGVFDSAGSTAPWRSPLFAEGWAAARRPHPGRAPRRAPSGAAQASAARAPSGSAPSGSAFSGSAPSGSAPPAATVHDRPGASERASSPSLEEARRWLAGGEVERALAAARAACARLPTHGGWRLLLADALRAERRWQEAADAYEQAVGLLPASRATSAGYLAAYVRMNELRDAVGALRALSESGAHRPGSPIEERATALLIRAHLAAGERQDALREGRRYLVRFPAGASRATVEALVGAEE